MSDLPNGISALIEKKLQEERKLIAKWLLEDFVWEKCADILLLISGQIERGEYRKGEGE
jgi:hypothetical protein